MWNRWKAGQSLMRLVEYSARINRSSISCWRATGGLRRAHVVARSWRSRWVSAKTFPAALPGAVRCGAIAQGLHRACSTISREVARYGGHAQYRANQADQQAWESALRPKPYLLATHSKLQEIDASKLMQDWSPEQISGWLKQSYPDDEGLGVSHETIYRSLFIQGKVVDAVYPRKPCGG